MTPQSTPIELSIAEARRRGPYEGTVVDSFALYAVQLARPLEMADRAIRSVAALRRWPGLDAIVSHDGSVVVQLFLLEEVLESVEQLNLMTLPFDSMAHGTIKLR